MQRQVEVLWMLIVGATLLIPLGGALFLWLSCKLLRIPNVSYLRSWLAYVSAYFVASLLGTGAAYVILSAPGRSETGVLSLPAWAQLIIWGVVLGTHVVLIPIVLGIRARLALRAHLLALCVYGAVISSIAFPLVLSAREAARVAVSRANLKGLALAMQEYGDGQRFPPAALCDENGVPLLSWRVLILPYIEEQTLFDEFKKEEPWDSPHNVTLLDRMPPIFAAPGHSGERGTETYYQVFVSLRDPHDWAAPQPPFWLPKPSSDGSWSRRVTVDPCHVVRIEDMPTLLVVEAGEPVPWTKPADLLYSPNAPPPKLGGIFDGGFNVAFTDSSTRFIRRDIPDASLRALITMNGGETPDGCW